ncbi:MAG: DUF4149 domain-containing protein [Thermomicrobiales bacterium]|nr:DUF4149 domain-containing protein [Thermomicrobiales bacterium]
MSFRTDARRRWLLPFVLLIVALAVLGQASETTAQSELERSDPRASSIVAESPAAIQLWFHEPIDAGTSTVRILDSEGDTVPDLAPEPGDDDRSLVVPLPGGLDNGTYTVVWSAVFPADGQTANGSFTFTIGSQIDIASTSIPTIEEPAGAPHWLQGIAHWLVVLPLAVAFAIWPIWAVVLWWAARGDDARVEMLSMRAQSLALGAIGVTLAANLFALGVEATNLARGSFVTRTLDTLFDTRYGRLWLAQVGLLLLLALVLRAAPWRDPFGRQYRSLAVLIVALLVPVPVSLDSHAATLETGRRAAIFFDYVQLVALSLWFGGLVLIAGVLLRSMRDQPDRPRVVTRAFSSFFSLALICWGLVAITGAYSWWLQAGSLAALRTTDYGRWLLIALVLVVAVVLVALLGLLPMARSLANAEPGAESTWADRLRYAVIAEIVLTASILLAMGQLHGLPPGREVLATEQFGQTVQFQLGDQAVSLQFAPGGAGPNHFLVRLPDESVPIGAQAFLGFTYLGQEIGSAETELGRSSLTTFETHGSEFGIAGDWDIELTLRLPDATEWSDTQPVTIDTAGSPVPEDPWRFGTGGAIGLVFLGIALVGFAAAIRSGKGHLRMESAGLGAAAIVLGLIVMVQGRIQPGDSYYSGLVNPVAATGDSVSRGSALFQANCLACHGATGNGDGPLSEGMFPPPADFSAPHTRVHSDGQLFDWIRNGKTDTDMPAFSTLTDEEIWDLINYIQVEFQGKEPDDGS